MGGSGGSSYSWSETRDGVTHHYSNPGGSSGFSGSPGSTGPSGHDG